MSRSRREILEQIAQQRSQQNVSLLRIYNYYRVVLGVSLLVIFVRGIGEHLLGTLDPDLFVLTLSSYIVVNVVFAAACLFLPARTLDRQLLGFFVVVADSLTLVLLMHFSAGVSSGIGALVIVSVAAGSIFVSGRIATVMPAVATLAVLYEEFYLSLLPDTLPPDFFQAGLLGALYFGTSLFIQDVSRRLQSSEITALQRAAEVAALERLNRLIVQRMRTGIIVLDVEGDVSLINEAARTLLATDRDMVAPALPEDLMQAWTRWREDSTFRAEPFWPAPDTAQVRVSFSQLADNAEGETLAFIEDNTELQQRAQQLKLAALGRLSASIAHEIRNPLGAISHAAQLLAESPSLEKPDQRLTDIIQTHSKRMNGVIENVLELSRRRQPAPQRMTMREWLQSFVEQFRETRETSAVVEMKVLDEGAVVNIDPSQLGQVLTNLVTNGLRYSEKETGTAWIRLEAGVDEASERPYLNVIDKGPGIPEAQRQHLFEPFFTTEESGTGLGLYISRELCEANQIQLGYQPLDPTGSCFRLNFPHPKRQPVASHD
ncbi:MAG: ATP-binding protein [Pseudomonadales bacterium]|nr:ATP-binding protein [Pseudomonadales bacterium]